MITVETPEPSQAGPPRPNRIIQRLSGGFIDAGLSSLATFLVGLAAAHYFATSLLGAYALAVTTASLAIAIPAIVIFTSVERDNSVRNEGPQRLAVLPSSTRAGLRLAIPAGAIAAGLFLAVAPRSIPIQDRVGLCATVGVFTCVSPVQDHIRRTLHQSRESLGAAMVSLTQLITVIAVLAVLLATHSAGQATTPLLTLSLANVASAFAGLRLSRRRAQPPAVVINTSLRHCFFISNWLLLSTLITFGCSFGVTAIVSAGSGPVATGQAEAARLVAQPVTLVIFGASAVLSADIISAVANSRRREIRRLLSLFFAGSFALAVIWTAIAARPWGWSPIPDVLPAAYVQLTPLVIMIAGESVRYASQIFSQVALAAHRGRTLAFTTGSVALADLAASVIVRRHGEMTLATLNLASATADILLGFVLFRKSVPQPIGGHRAPTKRVNSHTK